MLNIIAKLSLKNKIIISLGLFILILASIIYFIIIPTMDDIQTIENEIEQQRIDLEKRYIKGQSLRQLTDNLEIIEPQLTTLDQIFIAQDQELEFITTLEQLAEDNNISQKINLTINDKLDNTYQEIPVKISARGNYLNLMNYLTDLEALNYYINISSLDLSSSAQASSLPTPGEEIITSNISMIIEAITYWQ